MINILFNARDAIWPEYKTHLTQEFSAAGLDVNLMQETKQPEEVDYIIYTPTGPVQDFRSFKNVKLIQSIWAGVDVAIKNPTLTQPLARMVDDGMSEGMSDYVLGHVLRYHLGIDQYINVEAGSWKQNTPCLARKRTVGFLGIGALGMYCAKAVARQGFEVLGWSRTLKEDDMIQSFCGSDGLQIVLERSDILVLLMPGTSETENIINAKTIAQMKHGIAIINPGRGSLIDDADLIDGLNSGQISGATLDVFRVEPLPHDNPYWNHPNVLITPHIASETRMETAVPVIIDNIKRGENNQPFLHLVNRSVGY
ncbi:glyoxylate/hydroxypyruvate reductase A [Amylibacter sp. SFDW26]|uniref:2-hydroxyacid dehydrogenase n=1 Tax=Amylibacter sp. SFDW26 TaxID=2652722 RepID=UPI0012626EA5|nr:glyoxylate/hydroxypyruvate reductase A [Amylibacter sp. SFDW26]KAB7613822.1 glyoxylate/hydroxypyruvate reductase A [Amylibacter sp. SFDW26]